MSDELRVLLYPIGFLASIFFTLRFWVQLIASEKKKQSVAPRAFWVLSLMGNLILWLHSLIQIQLPVALIQSAMAVISFRNLNLQSKSPFSLKAALCLMGGALFLTVALFYLQASYIAQGADWVRTPQVPLMHAKRIHLPLSWHLFGSAGITLFALRFFFQWFDAEKKQASTLSPTFWWLSLTGAVCSLIYFVRSEDLVNILGYGVGIIPYARNLFLSKVSISEVKLESGQKPPTRKEQF